MRSPNTVTTSQKTRFAQHFSRHHKSTSEQLSKHGYKYFFPIFFGFYEIGPFNCLLTETNKNGTYVISVTVSCQEFHYRIYTRPKGEVRVFKIFHMKILNSVSKICPFHLKCNTSETKVWFFKVRFT